MLENFVLQTQLYLWIGQQKDIVKFDLLTTAIRNVLCIIFVSLESFLFLFGVQVVIVGNDEFCYPFPHSLARNTGLPSVRINTPSPRPLKIW